MDLYDLVARQFLRAVRGKRSQVAFSRRLGYRSNVAATWEAGRRSPSAADALRACRKLRLNVDAAFESFHAPSAPLLSPLSESAVASWLSAQRTDEPLASVAMRAGLSRFQVARCLSGQTSAALPTFFALVEAMTGRLAELVAALVNIEQVPSLLPSHHRQEAARTCAYAHPWSSAVLALLDTSTAARKPVSDTALRKICEPIAASLGISLQTAIDCVSALMRAGVLDGRLALEGALRVDTRREPHHAAELRRHWAAVGAKRLQQPGADDLFSFNVFALSRADYEIARQLQLEFFRRVQALAAASTRSEVAALLTVHLTLWGGLS